MEINKWCQPHWQMLREAIEQRGMMHLVPKSAEGGAAQLADEIRVGSARDREGFDPLMRAYWAISTRITKWTGNIVDCPLCQLQRHTDHCTNTACTAGTARETIDSCTDSLREYVRGLGLLQPPAGSGGRS